MNPSRWLIAIALSGCGGAVIADTPGVDGSNLPIVPVESAVVGDWVRAVGDLPDGVDVQTEGYVPLAFGAGYPTSITMVQGETWESRCLWEGEWTATDVSSADDSIVTAELASGDVALQVVGPGTALVTLDGIFDGGCGWDEEPPGRQQLRRVFQVIVAEPDGAVLATPYGCESALVVSDADLQPGFALVPTVGVEPFVPINALPGRQVSVELGLPDGLSAELPTEDAEFGELKFAGGAGMVTLTGPSGPIDPIEVVTPSQLTAMSLGWGVPSGNFGYTLPLEDGETYAWSEIYQAAGRQVLVVAGSPFVGDRAACSVPAADWLDVLVDPMDTDIDSGNVTGGRGEWMLGLGATVPESGPVSLSVTAPELNGGQGLAVEIEVTFTE